MAIPWAAIINAGAQLGSAYAANKATGRAAEATINQRQDAGAQQAYATDKSLDLEALVRAQQAELDRATGLLKEHEAKLAAPQSRAANAVRGDILANVQDVGVDAPAGVNVTSFSGGLRPSLLSGNTRALGSQMSKEALLDALSGSPTPFTETPRLDLASITGRSAPTQTPLPQASTLDKIMENIGLWGGAASAIGGALNQPQPTAAGQIAARGLDPRVQAGLPQGIGTQVRNPYLA